LPDGSRSEIPAAWTDLDKQSPQKFTLPARKNQADLIATASDFFHARKIVDNLFGNLPSSKQKLQTASGKENNHAKADEPLAHGGRAITSSGALDNPRSRATAAGDSGSGTDDKQNCLSQKRKTDQGGKQ
jgi:hypothetical protein